MSLDSQEYAKLTTVKIPTFPFHLNGNTHGFPQLGCTLGSTGAFGRLTFTVTSAVAEEVEAGAEARAETEGVFCGEAVFCGDPVKYFFVGNTYKSK